MATMTLNAGADEAMSKRAIGRSGGARHLLVKQPRGGSGGWGGMDSRDCNLLSFVSHTCPPGTIADELSEDSLQKTTLDSEQNK